MIEEGGAPAFTPSSPMTTAGLGLGSGPGAPASAISEYFLRLFQFDQMDFQYTYSQMVSLCRCAPGELYKATQIRRKIKNQWARDDPAFVVILMGMIAIASLAYCITFGVHGIFHLLRVVVGSVLVDFLGTGCAMATATSFVANRYLRVQRVMTTEQQVEWLYAFDIHCNGFFPLFVLLYPVQFFLTPLLLQPHFVATILANTLYAAAFAYYHYITVLGYSVLPFLRDQNRFFYPVGLILVLYFFACLLNFNMSKFVLYWYLG